MSRQEPQALCNALLLSSTRGACNNFAKFRYVMSDGPVYFSCGVKSHQKQIEDRLTDRMQCVREVCAPPSGMRLSHHQQQRDDTGDQKTNDFMKLYNSITREIRESTAREMRLRSEYSAMQRHQEELEDMLHNHGNLVEAVYERVHESARTTKSLQEKLAVLFRENKIALVLKWSPNCTSQSCSICLNAVDNPQSGGMLHCGHAFHNSCISEWVTQQQEGVGNPTCPLCRKDVRVESIIPKMAQLAE
jgi:hypothetical protein